MKHSIPSGQYVVTAQEAAAAMKKLGEAIMSTSLAFQNLGRLTKLFLEPFNKRIEQIRQTKKLFRRVLGKQIRLYYKN